MPRTSGLQSPITELTGNHKTFSPVVIPDQFRRAFWGGFCDKVRWSRAIDR